MYCVKCKRKTESSYIIQILSKIKIGRNDSFQVLMRHNRP